MISLKVMRYGYEKMVGSGMVRAEPNVYSMISMGINESKINAKTMMTMGFELRDPLLGSGLIMVQVPERITVIES